MEMKFRGFILWVIHLGYCIEILTQSINLVTIPRPEKNSSSLANTDSFCSAPFAAWPKLKYLLKTACWPRKLP